MIFIDSFLSYFVRNALLAQLNLDKKKKLDFWCVKCVDVQSEF